MQTPTQKLLTSENQAALPPVAAAPSEEQSTVRRGRRMDSPEVDPAQPSHSTPGAARGPKRQGEPSDRSGEGDGAQVSRRHDERAQETPGRNNASADDPSNDDAKPPLSRRQKLLRAAAIAAVAAVVVIGGVAYWLHARHFEDTDDAFIDGHIVQMASKVAGYVVSLRVKDNELVHAGDLLLEIDPREFQVSLEQAKAAEATAQGKLAQAEAQIAAAQAQAVGAKADVVAAQAMSDNSEIDLAQNKKLAPRGAVSQQSLDASTATARSNTAQLAAANARVALANAQIELARFQHTTAQAELQEARVRIQAAELNLSYAHVVAPITGRVTHRTVEQGDYLTGGQPLFALVDPEVWVTANFKETQLTTMRIGQPVVVSIDAYPDRPLRAHVDSFQRGSGAQL